MSRAYSRGSFRRCVLYVESNKNVAGTWLSTNRLQLPFATKYGYNAKITYPMGNVNTQNLNGGNENVGTYKSKSNTRSLGAVTANNAAQLTPNSTRVYTNSVAPAGGEVNTQNLNGGADAD
jgi:hypothetical protein